VPLRNVISTTAIFLIAVLGVVAALLFDRVTLDSLWLSFLGGFHPFVLHLPIGIIAVIAVRACLPSRTGPDEWLWWLAALTSTTALATGYLLGAEGGYDPELLDNHLWAAVAFSSLCWVGLWSIRSAHRPAISNILLALTLGTMTAAGHYGGVMVHGDPLAAAPWNLDPDRYATLPPLAAEVNVYRDLVVPIMGAKCVSCHGPARQKGRLRLDNIASLQRGGHSGPVIIPGNVSLSELLNVIKLPIRSDDHMPPVDHPQVSAVELAALSFWIDQGAHESIAIALDSPPEPFAALLEPGYRLLPDPVAEKARLAAAAQATEIQRATRTKLDELLTHLPSDLTPLFYFPDHDSANLTFNAIGRSTLTAPEWTAISDPLLSSYEINFAGVAAPAQLLAELARSPHVTRLNLRDTPVTNAQFAAFATTPALEILNLYGTTVTSIPAIAAGSFPHLQKLYLGRTAVTESDLALLRETLPSTAVLGSPALVTPESATPQP